MSQIPETPYRRRLGVPHEGVESWVFTILGLIMVFALLALWVAWTPAIFYGLLILIAACYGGVVLVCRRSFKPRA